MALTLPHRHVLEDHLSGFEANANPNHLTVAPRPVIFSVLAAGAEAPEIAGVLAAIGDISLRPCGPGEWLAVSLTAGAQTVGDLLADVAGAVSVDQSDGKVLMSLSGPSVRRLLAKCVAVDLHPDVFAEGHSANMQCCHVAVNLTRTGVDTFEIIAPRSFAGSVYEELRELGREYALTAGFSPA